MSRFTNPVIHFDTITLLSAVRSKKPTGMETCQTYQHNDTKVNYRIVSTNDGFAVYAHPYNEKVSDIMGEDSYAVRGLKVGVYSSFDSATLNAQRDIMYRGGM